MSKFIKTTKVQAFLRKLSTKAESATETISIASGAAGTVVNFYLPSSPVANANGTDVGGYGDSSLSFATGVFDTEVANNKTDAELANGEYWVNYLTGEGRGKKKTAGTSETVTYKHFVAVSSGGASPATVEGSASGDNAYYAKPSGTNADAVSAYASSTTLTVTGLPFAFTKYDIEYIQQFVSGGGVITFADKADFSVSGDTITVAGASFGASDTFIVKFSGQPRTENTAISAEQVEVLNPDSQNFSSNYESASSQGDGTTNYYYDLNGWKNGFSIQIEDTPGATGTNTYKVYASNQDDGTEDSSKTYQDITQYGMANVTGAAAASYTSNVFLKNVEGFMPVTIKVEVVRSGDGGSTDGAWDIFFKKY